MIQIKDTLTFNEIGQGDEHEISQMVKKVFDKFVAKDYTSEGFRTFLQFINPSTIHSRNFRGSSHTLLCRKEDKIIGVLEIQGWKHILLLFVDEDFHGQGIAKGLLNRALDICREKAIATEVSVNASPYGEPIYRKMGFIPAGPQQLKDGIKYTPMKIAL